MFLKTIVLASIFINNIKGISTNLTSQSDLLGTATNSPIKISSIAVAHEFAAAYVTSDDDSFRPITDDRIEVFKFTDSWTKFQTLQLPTITPVGDFSVTGFDHIVMTDDKIVAMVLKPISFEDVQKLHVVYTFDGTTWAFSHIISEQHVNGFATTFLNNHRQLVFRDNRFMLFSEQFADCTIDTDEICGVLKIYEFDGSSSKLVKTINGNPAQLIGATSAWCGNKIVSDCGDQNIRIFDSDTGDVLKTISYIGEPSVVSCSDTHFAYSIVQSNLPIQNKIVVFDFDDLTTPTRVFSQGNFTELVTNADSFFGRFFGFNNNHLVISTEHFTRDSENVDGFIVVDVSNNNTLVDASIGTVKLKDMVVEPGEGFVMIDKDNRDVDFFFDNGHEITPRPPPTPYPTSGPTIAPTNSLTQSPIPTINPTPLPTTLNPTTQAPASKSNNTIIFASIGCVMGFLLIAGGFIWYTKHKKTSKKSSGYNIVDY